MSDLLAAALLPPGALVVAAFVLLVGGWWRSGAVVLALLAALATRGVAGSLLAGLRAGPAGPAAAPGAIVIVPGPALELADPGGPAPGARMLERLRVGAALQRRTALPILVTGGRVPDGATTAASAMAASLQDDFGVTVRWQETTSRSIWESAVNSTAVLGQAGIAAVYLVTDTPEERLASAAFLRAGLAVTPHPVRRPTPLRLDRSVFSSATSTWLDSAQALEQWAGLACDAVARCAAWMR